jgi:O-methyltransferase
MTKIKYILRKLTTEKFRSWLYRFRLFMKMETKVIANPTFADDGLISQHISDFMKDAKFLDAYREGTACGGLENHPGGIQFRVYVCCWAASYAKKLKGDFVECGVGKGVISKAVCTYIDFNSTSKNFWLFDTFQGIPIDDAATNLERSNMIKLNSLHFDSDYSQEIRDKFRVFGKVIVVKGRVQDTLPQASELDQIAYLSIDMNNATAEIYTIQQLYGKLVPGGVIVLDDYAYGEEFRAQKDAWDTYAADNGISILSLPTGQGLIIKN